MLLRPLNLAIGMLTLKAWELIVGEISNDFKMIRI